MDSKKVIETLENITKKIDENKGYLSELDAAIGDGDHGINLSKGFNEVIVAVRNDENLSVDKILKKAGMTLVSKVGGASGPLYGTGFMKASMIIKDKNEVNIEDFIKMLSVALEGIKMRGKAIEGEKTMIDSMAPAIRAMEKSFNENKSEKEIISKGVVGAKIGVEKTKKMIATKGRASYLGERSLGHQDAGATSFTLLLEGVLESI
ncbi:dihydroxyacetone kinase subunit DhaL [uncultured Clostridium sp.]|uniref:dihydroxyacetone kinase subunit DhaL n=1 Tax=uncultured Clostridium sp. TaxID=59620 RepID=UPI00262E4050|nr:dihydroxyacetone kinase subunit DhaL [uncultured Clostridium sp.]